jgi:hypothetical protein
MLLQVTLRVTCEHRHDRYLQKSALARSFTCILAGQRGTCEYARSMTRNCECEYRRTRMLPCPAARHRGGTRSAGRRCGVGRCERRRRRCARVCVCAQTCGHAHARVSPCVGIAARTKDGIDVCMYVYVYKCMHCILYIYIYAYSCVRDGYGRSCGCTACNAHVRAIARADDAAVAITCARGYACRYSQRTRHLQDIYIHISTYIDAKSGYVNGYACV